MPIVVDGVMCVTAPDGVYALVPDGSARACLPFEQHFGLAAIEEAVESIVIRWPNGLRQRF
jgi:hypothetical protein